MDINALIRNLKQTENEIKRRHNKLIGIDYNKITNIFQLILRKYDELIMRNLRKARSFEELKRDNIQSLAGDVKAIADKAVRSKQNWFSNILASGFKNITNFSWLSKSNSKNNPRKCYWTDEIINDTSEIIPYILAIWTLNSASCYYVGFFINLSYIFE